MMYKGRELLLDNFREVLKDFSVDIQDVMRSAILDGVDIVKYLDMCAQNPYRLDQIRLGTKEGIDPHYFEYKSGEIIRGIRGLLNKGVNLSPFLKYATDELSDKCLLFLIYWCKEGYDPSYLNLTIIPDNLLEFFDMSLKYGFNVKEFNNGTYYGLEYLDYCMKIMENKCSYTKYAQSYGLDVIKYMCKLSWLPNKSKYNALYGVLSTDVSLDMLMLYEKAYSVGLDLKKVARIKDRGVLEAIVKAKERGVSQINGKSIEDAALSYKSVESLQSDINTQILKNNRILSGKLSGK